MPLIEDQETDLLEAPIALASVPVSAMNGNGRIKRGVDLSIAITGIALLAPTLLPVVGFLNWLEGKGPLFFVQLRVGLNGQIFRCYKIRTMLPDDGHTTPAERITPLGWMLRKSHVDELPQLWNVLMGDMSIVGPRPHMLSDHEEFSARVSHYHLRHVVRPGITGLAQVKGFYGHVEDESHLQQRTACDLEYIRKMSAHHDAQIMWQTLVLVVRGK